MRETNDWRLTNQERYLKGVALRWQPYSPASPGNDHDHCEFCFAKFMHNGGPDTLVEGFATSDRYRWICKTCFDDFADLFEWQVSPKV
jgi:hypothetical protein